MKTKQIQYEPLTWDRRLRAYKKLVANTREIFRLAYESELAGTAALQGMSMLFCENPPVSVENLLTHLYLAAMGIAQNYAEGRVGEHADNISEIERTYHNLRRRLTRRGTKAYVYQACDEAEKMIDKIENGELSFFDAGFSKTYSPKK